MIEAQAWTPGLETDVVGLAPRAPHPPPGPPGVDPLPFPWGLPAPPPPAQRPHPFHPAPPPCPLSSPAPPPRGAPRAPPPRSASASLSGPAQVPALGVGRHTADTWGSGLRSAGRVPGRGQDGAAPSPPAQRVAGRGQTARAQRGGSTYGLGSVRRPSRCARAATFAPHLTTNRTHGATPGHRWGNQGTQRSGDLVTVVTQVDSPPQWPFPGEGHLATVSSPAQSRPGRRAPGSPEQQAAAPRWSALSGAGGGARLGPLPLLWRRCRRRTPGGAGF